MVSDLGDTTDLIVDRLRQRFASELALLSCARPAGKGNEVFVAVKYKDAEQT